MKKPKRRYLLPAFSGWFIYYQKEKQRKTFFKSLKANPDVMNLTGFFN